MFMASEDVMFRSSGMPPGAVGWVGGGGGRGEGGREEGGKREGK